MPERSIYAVKYSDRDRDHYEVERFADEENFYDTVALAQVEVDRLNALELQTHQRVQARKCKEHDERVRRAEALIAAGIDEWHPGQYNEEPYRPRHYIETISLHMEES